MTTQKEELDLDIENYTFDEITSLFGLETNTILTERDIKNAYKVVLKTHPDKSKLDKSVFLFYSKAFKLLKSVYDYTNKAQKCVNIQDYKKNEYVIHGQGKTSLKESILHKKLTTLQEELQKYYNYLNHPSHTQTQTQTQRHPRPQTHPHSYLHSHLHIQNHIKTPEELYRDFYHWFEKTFGMPYSVWLNVSFEKIKVEYDDERGYGDWLKSNDNILDETELTGTKEEVIQRQRDRLTSMIQYKGLKDTEYTQHTSSLNRGSIEEYSSDVFSKLKYEDIRKAHTETVIAVDEKDIHKRPHFKGVDDFIRYRKNNEGMIDETTSKHIMENRKKEEDTENIQRAYSMMKQYEQIKKQNSLFMANLKFLQN